MHVNDAQKEVDDLLELLEQHCLKIRLIWEDKAGSREDLDQDGRKYIDIDPWQGDILKVGAR
jgi:hypothetical protein